MIRKSFDGAVTDFVQAVGLLVRRVRAEGGQHELSWSQMFVLKRLESGPATTAELARAEGVKPQSMGTTVASLEELGLVERHPHPSDGRQVHIALSAHGAEVRRSSGEAKRAWVAQAIAGLDRQEQEALFAAGEIIRRLAEQ